MKIGILSSISWRTPPRTYGGWELVTSLLTEELVKLGHEVHLFASGDSITGAKLHWISAHPLSEITNVDSRVMESLHIANCFEIVNSTKLDILHNHTGCFPLCYANLIQAPIITTLHGSGAEAGSAIIYKRYKNQAYVSISDSERRLLPELNYISTVYNGIDIESFPLKDKPGTYLLLLGRMSPDKGVHLAIDLAKKAGIKLILAGIIPNENYQYFNEHVKPHLANNHVEYVGPVNHTDKCNLLLGALALLQLVTYQEAFGLTMVEALATGTPVLATPRGSVFELIKTGINGEIIAEDNLAAQLQAIKSFNGFEAGTIRDSAEKFSAKNMALGYLEAYKKILSQ